MQVHDWTRVNASVFRSFRHSWIHELSKRLNGGLLPKKYYSQIAPTDEKADRQDIPFTFDPDATTEWNIRAGNRITIRSIDNHMTIAIADIVQPGVKDSCSALKGFAERVTALIRSGIHVLLIDLLPPPNNSSNVHSAIWSEVAEDRLEASEEHPLLIASYVGGADVRAYVEPNIGGLTLDRHAFVPDARLLRQHAAGNNLSIRLGSSARVLARMC